MFADLPTPILVHLVTAAAALPLGLYLLLAPKGTRVHRALGHVYFPLMLVSLLSALSTFRAGHSILFFHMLALVGLWSLASGGLNLVLWFRNRSPGRLRAHMLDMGYSWLGLLMAGVSQILVNPRFGLSQLAFGWSFWTLFGAINLLLYAAGSWWIHRRLVPKAAAARADPALGAEQWARGC